MDLFGRPAVRLSYVFPSVCPPLCHFQMINKCQWIFTKLGLCIDIVKIWFGIFNGQISSIFDRVICLPLLYVLFPDNNLSKNQWVFTKLCLCIDISEIWFEISDGKISSITDMVIVVLACSRVRYRRPLFRPSVSSSVRLSTFMSTFDIYVKVSILINYKTKQPSNLA